MWPTLEKINLYCTLVSKLFLAVLAVKLELAESEVAKADAALAIAGTLSGRPTTSGPVCCIWGTSYWVTRIKSTQSRQRTRLDVNPFHRNTTYLGALVEISKSYRNSVGTLHLRVTI